MPDTLPILPHDILRGASLIQWDSVFHLSPHGGEWYETDSEVTSGVVRTADGARTFAYRWSSDGLAVAEYVEAERRWEERALTSDDYERVGALHVAMSGRVGPTLPRTPFPVVQIIGVVAAEVQMSLRYEAPTTGDWHHRDRWNALKRSPEAPWDPADDIVCQGERHGTEGLPYGWPPAGR